MAAETKLAFANKAIEYKIVSHSALPVSSIPHNQHGSLPWWRCLAALGDAPPLVRLLRRVQRPTVLQSLPAIVATHGYQVAVTHQGKGVGVACTGTTAVDDHSAGVM